MVKKDTDNRHVVPQTQTRFYTHTHTRVDVWFSRGISTGRKNDNERTDRYQSNPITTSINDPRPWECGKGFCDITTKPTLLICCLRHWLCAGPKITSTNHTAAIEDNAN